MGKKYHIYESINGESQDIIADSPETALIKWLAQNRALYRGRDRVGDSFNYDFSVTRVSKSQITIS